MKYIFTFIDSRLYNKNRKRMMIMNEKWNEEEIVVRAQTGDEIGRAHV